VPEGVPVTFRATSSDVVHGFQIIGTNVNSMVVPGYVSTFVTTLNGAGERTMPCHEFCGVGHAAMWARVRVLPRGEFQTLIRARARANCV
jgi:cytochrome c oxidase subunit 2